MLENRRWHRPASDTCGTCWRTGRLEPWRRRALREGWGLVGLGAGRGLSGGVLGLGGGWAGRRSGVVWSRGGRTWWPGLVVKVSLAAQSCHSQQVSPHSTGQRIRLICWCQWVLVPASSLFRLHHSLTSQHSTCFTLFQLSTSASHHSTQVK